MVAMLGIWHAVAHGRRRAGAVIAIAGAVVAVVATAVIVPHYAAGGGSPVRGPLRRGRRLAGRDRRGRP